MIYLHLFTIFAIACFMICVFLFLYLKYTNGFVEWPQSTQLEWRIIRIIRAAAGLERKKYPAEIR